MASSTMRKVSERGTDAFNRHDMEAFQANLTDDVTLTAPGGMQLRGKEPVTSFYRGWIEAFPDAHVDIREMHEMDDCMVEEGTFTGTHQGVLHTPRGDLPATGRCFSGRYIEVVRVRDERVASFDLVFDRLELLEQLGMAEAPSAATSRRDDADTAYAAAPH